MLVELSWVEWEVNFVVVDIDFRPTPIRAIVIRDTIKHSAYFISAIATKILTVTNKAYYRQQWRQNTTHHTPIHFTRKWPGLKVNIRRLANNDWTIQRTPTQLNSTSICGRRCGRVDVRQPRYSLGFASFCYQRLKPRFNPGAVQLASD